jgi:proliferating cell nuclear antigen
MSEILVEAIAEKRVPQALVDTFTPIVSECKMHFNDDGIHVRAVEPANVAMGYVDLDRAAFASYESPGAVTQGVNLDSMDERLGVGDSGDLAQLALDMESRKLNVDVGNVHQAMALIDPDAVREEPDLPDLDLPNTVVLSGKQVRDAIDAVGMVSDHVEIRGDPELEVVEFVGEGDVDETVVEFGQEEAMDGTQAVEAGASLFSHEYSEALAKPIPNDAEVSITFGDEFPAVWDWSAVDGHMDVTQMIAPRIRSR